MAAKKSTSKSSSKKNPPRPAPARTPGARVGPHMKTMANGQPRPKSRKG